MAGTVASNATANDREAAQKSVPVIASTFSSPLRALKDVANGLCMPLAPACRGHTPRIECFSAICLSVVAPAFCASRMMGRTLAAKRSTNALGVRFSKP